MDIPGFWRGFGFVTFANPTDVEKVLEIPIHEVDGKQVVFLPFFSQEINGKCRRFVDRSKNGRA